MVFVSVTRLRLRAIRYVLPFFWHASRSGLQARRAEGHVAVSERRAQGAYWTVTVWRDKSAMRGFMMGGAHRTAMRYLADWCDEASLTHWEQENAMLPSWEEAERRLAAEGRVSAVNFPSPAHSAGATLGTQPSISTATVRP